MPQLFQPDTAARSMLAALRYLSVLPRTVNTAASATEFVPGRGATVNILSPISAGEAKLYTAANRTARDAIEFDDIDQTWVPVTMDTQVYKALRLPDDISTFDITQVEAQLLVPMATSVVDSLALSLLAKMETIETPAEFPVLSTDGTNWDEVLIAARKELNSRNVPMANRYIAVSADVEAILLRQSELREVDKTGSDGALRDAILGRIFGFTIVADPRLTEGTAVAYESDAFTFVTRPSRQPDGAAWSRTAAQDGFAIRLLQHYDPLHLEDQLVADVFVGSEVLDENRALSFTTGEVTP